MFTIIMSRIRAHFRKRRMQRQRPTIEANAAFLSSVHSRLFPASERSRFELLWCEIADICEVHPTALCEDMDIGALASDRKDWIFAPSRMEELEHLILIESEGRPPPRERPATIGDILEYLLGSPDHQR
jgi:hypothetical protein